MDEGRLRDFETLVGAWDEVNAASRVVECALPFQMSEAIDRLIRARDAMNVTVREIGLGIVTRHPS